jgi:peroxiredoxin
VLSDFDKNITNTYGVMHDGGMSQRAVFIVDKEGNIAYLQVQENIREIPSLDLIFAELEKIQ